MPIQCFFISLFHPALRHSLTSVCGIFQWYSTIRPDSSSTFKENDIKHKKTLLLDLDETLVHSTIKQPPSYHFRLKVMLTKIPTEFFVIKRPFVDKFLAQVREKTLPSIRPHFCPNLTPSLTLPMKLGG